MINYSEKIKEYIAKEIEVLNSIDTNSINLVMNEINKAYEKSANIYLFGNGGSAATASHLLNDFNQCPSIAGEKKFNFICLNDNIPTVLAIANDFGFEHIFSHQIKNKLKKDDLVIGLSGSGNSTNILEAIKYAKSQNVKTIGISGFDGGNLALIADISFCVGINNIQITEDVHMILGHLMANVFRQIQ